MRNLPAEEQLAGDPALARPLCAELGRQLSATNLGNLSPEMGGACAPACRRTHGLQRGSFKLQRNLFELQWRPFGLQMEFSGRFCAFPESYVTVASNTSS